MYNSDCRIFTDLNCLDFSCIRLRCTHFHNLFLQRVRSGSLPGMFDGAIIGLR